MEVLRIDRGQLRRPERREDGFLSADAFVTRAGVFEYERKDGTIRRELRPPEEVFHEDSLKSLQLVPLTLGHPPERVTSQNAKQYQVGTVGSDARREDGFVRASLMVTDGQAIASVEARRTDELSCGYKVQLEETSGVHPQYGRYDAIQRRIRYNHCAFVTDGRAGRDVRVRLDSSDAIMVDRTDSVDPPSPATPPSGVSLMKIRIDGVEYDVPEQTAQAIQKQFSRHDEEVKSLRDKLDAAESAASESKGRADTAEAKLKEVEQERDDARDPEKIRKAARERAALENEAKEILGDDFKFDEASDFEIRKAVVAEVVGDRFDSSTTDEPYVKGAYDLAVSQAKSASQSRDDVGRAAQSAGGESRADAAREKFFKQQEEAHKSDLTAHV